MTEETSEGVPEVGVSPEEFAAEMNRLELLIKEHEEAQAKQQKEAAEKSAEFEQQLAEKFEANQKMIESNGKQIEALTDDVKALKKAIEVQMSIEPDDPTSHTYEVILAQDQIEKLKVREEMYLEKGALYVSIFIGLVLGYIGIKGLLGRWNTGK